MDTQKTIKKSELLKMQEQGMKREEIAKHFQVPDSEMKKIFQMLKITTKAKKKISYNLENDVDSPVSPPENTGVLTPQEETVLNK